MQGILATIESAEFKIDQNGYLIRPDVIQDLEIKLGQSVYRLGIGGLHSSEKCQALIEDDDHEIYDRDVASYYPRILINCNLKPQRLGDNFLVVYKQLVQRRLDAKRKGDIAVSECLKISINGTFGKTGNPFSILYAPEVIVQILLGGQLYLLMLIERLEAGGIPIYSANTDGFIMRCHKRKRAKALKIIAEWEKQTHFETEETRYHAVYSRDVNAYLAIKPDGSVKGKNAYYDPWRVKSARDAYWQFQKNPQYQICVEAVERFVAAGKPIADTVLNCQDIKRFVAIRNVTGGAHKAGDYLGKTVRWYIAKGEEGSINYIKNNNQVADTQGAKPLMDLPDELPADIDYDYYISRCNDMLENMGWKPIDKVKERK
jgi:DNA polymerase elongation subunit (family B)